jgi:hypothetical protein
MSALTCYVAVQGRHQIPPIIHFGLQSHGFPLVQLPKVPRHFQHVLVFLELTTQLPLNLGNFLVVFVLHILLSFGNFGFERVIEFLNLKFMSAFQLDDLLL